MRAWCWTLASQWKCFNLGTQRHAATCTLVMQPRRDYHPHSNPHNNASHARFRLELEHCINFTRTFDLEMKEMKKASQVGSI